MKKLCLILITVMLSSFLNVYADSPRKFEDRRDTLNVVYFGGSITVGSGSTSGNSWREKVGNWFTETYPGTTVKNFNAGIGGTGTELGYYRAYKDVLVHNPDIVFVEFAVNDRPKTEQETQFLLESIIRGFQNSPSNPYVILVYTSEMVNGEYKDASEYQKKIAEYYNIPDIDLQPVIQEYLAIPGNQAQGGFFCEGDTTHPSDIGYALYTEKIIECLETGDYFKTPDVKETSYVKENYGIDAMDCSLPKFDSACNNEAVTLTGNWTKKSHWQHGDYMFTNTPGATLEYKFSGPVLGMFSMVSQGGGKLKVEIDGVHVDTIDTYYKLSSNPIHAAESSTLHYDNKELSDSEHTLKFTVLDEINPNNQIGTNDISIYGFYSSAIVRGLEVEVNNNTRVVKVKNRTNVIDGEPFTIGVWPGSSADDVDFENDEDNRVGNSAVCIDQGTIQDEKIDYTFSMPQDAMSGEYYVQTRNLNDDTILWTTFLFTNAARQAETKEMIAENKILDNYDSLEDFLDERLKDIDAAKSVKFDDFSDEQKLYVVDEIKDYTGYDEFESKLENTFNKIDLLSRLKNETKFEAAKDELLANTANFGITNNVMTKYNNLTSGSQSYALLYFREKVKDAVTPAIIPTLFEAAVTVAENSADDDNLSPGPSSGGGGFGGGAGAILPGTDTPLNPSVSSVDVFTDLGSVEWARTAITTLAQKGVINGKGNQKFAPLDKVTREEFLKMILVAFDIETEPADLKFTDVDKNAWYYTYVAQAVSYGIINGISDTEFGTGKNITRQDAAVILSRAVEKDKFVEIYTVDSGFKFNDIDKVSDYAAAAVETLGKAKIFSGKENNMFDPFGQATRAEAAMILYNLLYK